MVKINIQNRNMDIRKYRAILLLSFFFSMLTQLIIITGVQVQLIRYFKFGSLLVPLFIFVASTLFVKAKKKNENENQIFYKSKNSVGNHFY